MRKNINNNRHCEPKVRQSKTKTLSNSNRRTKIIRFSLFGTLGAILLAFLATVCVRAVTLRKAPVPAELSEQQKDFLNLVLDKNYPERKNLLHPLPYATKPAALDVWAKSAIAVDATNGCILYEKNADEIIPPASMTKIFVMYVIMEEIEKGNAALSDIVPLPPETWACNQPPHSSLMFLGKNQKVTLEEVITGLDVCSGNDAAVAIALYLFGNVDSFVQKINDLAAEFNLQNTHFFDASGYSEKNTTTAREMASFTRHYIEKFPEAIYKFHSVPGFKYPKEENLAPEDKILPTRFQDFSQGLPENIYMPIYQKNTNPLLGKLEGCDGLKTGYIEESGYNLALTVKRGNTRILSVTMGGPGNSQNEGQAGRVHDGTEITEWAYKTFADYENPLVLRSYNIPAVFAKTQRISIIPAFSPKALSVPVVAAADPENALKEVKINLVLPEVIKGTVDCGKVYGEIQYLMNSYVLQKIPLVADRNVKRANWWICAADFIAQIALKL